MPTDRLYRCLRLCNQLSIDRGLLEYFGPEISQEDPQQLAQFLHCHHRVLDPWKLGAYFCSHLKSLEAFLPFIISGECSDLLLGLRLVLARILIAGQEAQSIDNVLLYFSKRFVEVNQEHWLYTNHMDDPEIKVELTHVLTYSLLLLNTDLNNQSVKRKMGKLEFIRLVMRCLCADEQQNDDHVPRGQYKYRCPSLRLSMFLAKAYDSLVTEPISLDGQLNNSSVNDSSSPAVDEDLDEELSSDEPLLISTDPSQQDHLKTLFMYSTPPLMSGWLRKMAPQKSSKNGNGDIKKWTGFSNRWNWKQRFFVLVRGADDDQRTCSVEKSPIRVFPGQCLYYFSDSFKLPKNPSSQPSADFISDLKRSNTLKKSKPQKIPKVDDLLKGIIPLDGLYVYPLPYPAKEDSKESDSAGKWFYFEISSLPPPQAPSSDASNPTPPVTPIPSKEASESSSFNFPSPPTDEPPADLLERIQVLRRSMTAPVLTLPGPPAQPPPNHLTRSFSVETTSSSMDQESIPITKRQESFLIRASKKNSGGLMIPSNHHSFVLGCESREERDRWVRILTGWE